MKGLRVSIVLVACVVTAGCGSSGGKKTDGGGGSGGTNGDGGVGASCSFTTACGGDIAGTWRVVAACSSASCAAMKPIRTETVPSAGQDTYTFASGGTFTYAFSGGLTETLHYPIECLANVSDAGIPQACVDLQNLYEASLQTADGGTISTGRFTSATCSAEETQGCVCALAFTYAPGQTGTGSYTTSGNQVTITFTSAPSDGGVGDGGTSSPAEYCISGNTLTLRFTVSSGSQTGEIVQTFTK
jgi:hypothetical protein